MNTGSSPGCHFYGFFKNGQASGHFWVEMEGGGHLHGEASPNGLISGDSIAFIYPDGKTALLGNFEDRIMKEVRLIWGKTRLNTIHSNDALILGNPKEYLEPS